VQGEQNLQKIDRRLDELRDDAEAVHQNEFFGFPLGQLIAIVSLVGLRNGIQVAAIKLVQDRVVQLREQLVESEGQRWRSIGCIDNK
jgi:hypothetical protein